MVRWVTGSGPVRLGGHLDPHVQLATPVRTGRCRYTDPPF